jgi:hypothetical protein
VPTNGLIDQLGGLIEEPQLGPISRANTGGDDSTNHELTGWEDANLVRGEGDLDSEIAESARVSQLNEVIAPENLFSEVWWGEGVGVKAYDDGEVLAGKGGTVKYAGNMEVGGSRKRRETH